MLCCVSSIGFPGKYVLEQRAGEICAFGRHTLELRVERSTPELGVLLLAGLIAVGAVELRAPYVRNPRCPGERRVRQCKQLARRHVKP
jgi:hypothetical protein